MLAHALILMDGSLEVGVRAVDGFHRALDLGPIKAEVHVTLADLLGTEPDWPGIARRLEESAQENMALVGAAG